MVLLTFFVSEASIKGSLVIENIDKNIASKDEVEKMLTRQVSKIDFIRSISYLMIYFIHRLLYYVLFVIPKKSGTIALAPTPVFQKL